jgi:hypothetical protein
VEIDMMTSSGLERWDSDVYGLESCGIGEELTLADAVALLEQWVPAESSKPWVSEWGSKCASFILWHIQHGMSDCLLQNVRHCFLDALDEHLIVGRSHKFINVFGEEATLDTARKPMWHRSAMTP